MGRREESPVRSSRKERDRERSPIRDVSSRNKRHSRSKSPSVRPHRSSTHTKSPDNSRTKRDVSESPSPRTKRLKRAKAERQVGRGDRELEEENNGRRKNDRERERERDRHVDKEADREVDKKRDRRSGRDERDRDYEKRERRGSSPPLSHRGGRDEPRSPRDDEQQNGDDDSLAKMKAAEETLEAKEAKDKQKPSFELSGKLAEETNRFRGVTLLFNEPPDARMSDIRWRLYVFKGGEPLNEPLYVHRQSCYLFGRERRVADIPTDHPSCSKQHAVLQYRQVEQENPDGTTSKRVRPYLMDLGSTNGTFINDDRIEAQRYYELCEKDNIKFGNSSREYVLLHENSAA